MTSIPQTNHPGKPRVFNVPICGGVGHLSMTVDSDGSRWLALAPLAELLGLSFARDIMPRIEPNSRFYAYRSIGGRHCLPMERTNELIATLFVLPAYRDLHHWLSRNALQTLRDFHVPEVQTPMLDVEPGRVSCPLVHASLPALVIGEAIPIVSAEIDGSQVNAVNARDLHQFLEVGKVFATWISDRIQQYGFVEHQDFETCFPVSGSEIHGGQNRKEYLLSMNMAKELAMVERNAKGKEARAYFIDCERKAMAPQNPILSMSRLDLLKMAVESEEKIQTLGCQLQERDVTISILEPKAAGLDRIATMTTDTARTLTDTAKILQQAPRKFIVRLQAEGWIYRQNGRWMAYQPKITQGLMEHKFCNVQHDTGTEFDVAQPLVTPKGIAKLASMFGGAA